MTSRRTPAVSPLPVWAGGLGALALCFLLLPLAFELRPGTWTRLMVAVMRLAGGPDLGILLGSGP